MVLANVHHPHDSHAPPADVPHRDCPKCGKVTGFNLTGNCCLCGLAYLPDPSDTYARVIEQQRNAESRLP